MSARRRASSRRDGTRRGAERGATRPCPGSCPLRRAGTGARRRCLVAAATAAILVIGTVFAVNQFTGEDTLTALQECIEQAPDRRAAAPQAGAGRRHLPPSCAGVLVDVSGLPALPDDRTYQLWMLAGRPSRRGR